MSDKLTCHGHKGTYHQYRYRQAAAMAFFFVLLLAAHGAAPALGFTRSDFPPDFVFGAATSAYQYEGAVAEDGRSPSIWDTFTHVGKMADKSTGDVASDGYHKYKDDVKLMADTNLEAYRFSISWPRLIPNGRGAVNPKGLEYYNNLINELVKHGRISRHLQMYALESLETGFPSGLRSANLMSSQPTLTVVENFHPGVALILLGEQNVPRGTQPWNRT